MKDFLKFTFASFLGFLIALFVLVLIVGFIIGGIASSLSEKKAESSLKNNSVLELDLSFDIPERSNKNTFSLLAGMGSKPMGLNEIILNIKKAAENDQIKGIKLNCGLWLSSYATLEEIRNELINFKQSGKFIVAYGEIYDEHSYYVASIADKIFINPAGQILLNGFSTQVVYLKNMLQKIGVEPQLIRHGKFKSAGEPFIADKMSNENRMQIESYMGNLYRYFVKNIAADRKINESELTEIINELKIRTPQHAVDYKIIDGIKYADEVESEIKKMTGLNESDELNTMTLKAFSKVPNPNTSVSDNKIAVLYLNGEIMGGNGGEETIGSDKIAETIKEIRTKGKYKAIVLRINSPGGSALASDVMWREITLAKEKMPVVVSMGTLAASGGYYIAAPADKIFALPNTLTGSIGVFGMLVNAQKLLKDKIGVNIETVKFGKYADLGSPERPLTADEEAIIQNEIDKVYEDFISKVAQGRNLTKQQVDDLAQGRVYSGIEAKQLGLIDEFGGLDDAIKFAAQKAKLSDYRTVNLPELKDPLDDVIGILSSNAQAWYLKQQIGAENAEIINKAKKIQHLQGIQMLLPYQISIH